MKTEKLFERDSYLRSFDATVLSVASAGDLSAVVWTVPHFSRRGEGSMPTEARSRDVL